MRSLIVMLALLSACATKPDVEPNEYLDEKTAATITAVPDPWIFHREGTTPQLDFIHLYAVDVNRMGEHRQYLVVVKHWPAPDLASGLIPGLEVTSHGEQLRLDPVEASARELGIGQPLDESAPRGAQYWFYPIERSGLEFLTRSPDVKLGLFNANARASYVVWRDSHAAFRELSETLSKIHASH